MILKANLAQIKKTKNLLIVLSSIILFFTIIFIIYKSTIDISDSNIDKFNYDLNSSNIKNDYKFIDFLSYNSNIDKNIINIDIPIDYFYNNIIDIENLQQFYIDNYNIKLNKIGLVSNISNNNIIDFYADITYHDLLDAYISGTLTYKFFDNNDIEIYVKDIIVGDGLPSIFYKPFININNADLTYRIKADDYYYLNNNVLNLEHINDIRLKKDSFTFKYNLLNNIDAIGEYIFNDYYSSIKNSINDILPIVLEICIGENSQDYSELFEYLLPLINNDINMH